MEKIILILKIKFICNKKCTCKNFMIIKIGFIKIDDLYLIVGNRENQMFYIFQYFAPTNNKYSKNNKIERNTYKLIYSIWIFFQYVLFDRHTR